MKKEIKELINSYWKFDEFQHPTSSWHDKQDLLDKIDELFNSSGHDEVQAIRQNDDEKEFCMYCQGTGIAIIQMNGRLEKGKCGCQTK